MYGQPPQKVAPKPKATPMPDDDREVGLDEWDDIVADRYKVPRSLMKSVRMQESGGNVSAKSPTGVRGRYQVTEATAKQYGLDRNNPWQQSVAAAKHLRKMFDETDGADDDEKWLGAVGKYYGGSGAVKNGVLSGDSVDGVSNPAEHVRRVAEKWGQYRREEGGQPATKKEQRRQNITALQDELTATTPQVKPGNTLNVTTGRQYPTPPPPPFQPPIDMRLNAPNEAQKAFDRAAAATGQQPAAPKPRNAFQAPRPKPMLERVMAQQAIERQQPQTVETDPQRMEQVRQATAQQLATQRQVRQVQAREDVAQMNPLQRMAVRGMAKVGGATNADLAETMPVSGVESTLGQFGQGAITTAARIPEGMERLGQSLPNVFDPFRANARLRESQRQAGQNTLLTSGITKAGDAFADTVAPIDKTDEGFLTAKLPRGLGSSVPFLASSALGGGMPAAAALGAAINAQQTGEDLDRMGVQDEATRQKATAVAGLIGTLEAFGVEGRLGKIFGGQGGVLKRLLGAGGEGLQEWTTEELNDINAKLIAAYDPNRSIDPFQRKQLEAAALGALTGGLFEAGGGIAQAAQQRPITQARQAIDARSAANAAAIAPQVQPVTEPLTEPLTAPVQAAPVAAGRSQDFRRRGAQLLGEEIEEAAPVAPVTPQAAPVVQPVAQPAPEPTVTGALRAEADAAKIEAGELEQAGDFASAVNAYDAAHKNLKLLRRRLGTPKTPEDVSLINQIDREISLAATNRQKAKEQARGMARQANAQTTPLSKELSKSQKPNAQVPLNQVVESAPLLRPDAVQNPEGGIPQMPEPTFTDRLESAARRDEAARGKAKPAKRLLSRIAELGGISDRYAGELQDVKDARRIGVIRQKAQMSPDVLARQLQSEGYDVDPEDLNTLWEAARRDIAGRDERTSQTSELERRLAEEEAAYNERQPFDEIVADVDAEPTNRLREAEYEGGEMQRYSKPLEGQPVEREPFRPDTADLREVREFGKRPPQTEQFTEEPPTAPLARRREPIRPPAPASPRQVGNRPLLVDVAGTRTPVAMSPEFPRARREMVRQGREVDALLKAKQEKGEFGNVAEAMFKSNTPDVLHGQDSFFHDPDVKGKLGLTRDAEMADVRRELKTQLAKSLNLSVDEISLSHIKPEVWRAWAKQKGLGREAVRKLEAGIARAERKQRAVETNAQIVAEGSQRAQADVRPAKARPADLEKQIKDIQSLVGWTIDEAEAKRQIAALRARQGTDAGFSVGRLRNEPQGEFAASGLGGFQSLFDRKPKTKPARPVEKDWNAQKWAKKFYTDSILNALSPEDRAKYSQAKTDKERNAVVLQANLAPDFEAKVFQFIDDATDAFEKGNLQEAGEVVAKGREFMSGQLSDKARDVNWFDHMQSRLSNANFKGTYERLAGQQGKEISEIFRNAQVDAANGKITRAEAVTRLQRELKPYIRRLKSSGKPGLARWVENHIDAVSDPDQSFRGLAGFLRGFQYNTKLRLNPRSALINTLQPFQTLWPHLTTAEWLRIQRDAARPATWKRVSEVAARESGGSIEEVNDQKRFLGWADLFSPVSEYNRIVGHLAGELFADRNGLTGDAKARMAADWAKKVEFDNSAYDIPPLFSGKIAGVVGQFKPFMVKNLERLYTDWKSAPPEALATNSWKGAGTIARRSKMITAQLLIGGVRSAIPGLKTIGGVLVLGGLAKAFSKFMDDDTAEKLAEAVYFGAPALVEQDLSGSVAVFDEPFGKTGYEKMVNFAGGPTLSLIAKAYEEGSAINEAKDSKTQTKSEKQKDAALRLAKAVTPYTKWGIAGAAAMRGERPSMWLGKEVPMTKAETIGYSLLGTPLRQSKYYEHKEAFDWQKGLMPERFEKEDKGTGTRILPDGKIDAGMIRQKVGEPEAVYKQRVERVEGWMSEYGDKLLSHPSYSLLTESQKKAAVESLRRRIGAQQNAAQPKLGTLAPEKVIQSVLKSEATRPKRDAGKLWVSPATRP